MNVRHFHKYGSLFLLSLFISVEESTAKFEVLQAFPTRENRSGVKEVDSYLLSSPGGMSTKLKVLEVFQSAKKGSRSKEGGSLTGERSANLQSLQISPNIENVFAVTVVDTYLNIPNGDIVAGINPIAASQKHKKQTSVLLFGKFKKCGLSPQEVVQVVWTELGVETKKTLKKEKLLERIESAFRYRSSLLPRKTKLKLKGDMKALMRQAEHFLASEDLTEPKKSQERVETPSPRAFKEEDTHGQSIKDADGKTDKEDEQEVSVKDLASKVPERERQEIESSYPGPQRSFVPSSRKRQGQEFQQTNLRPESLSTMGSQPTVDI